MVRYGVDATNDRTAFNPTANLPMLIELPLSASTLPQLPARTARKSEWAAALAVLTSKRFATDDRVWRHVDDDMTGIAFREMLADGPWTSGERLLLEFAASLYGAGVGVDAGRLLALGDSSRAIALRAVSAYLCAQ